MGCAEGRSPFAGSLRVPSDMISPPFLASKLVETVFQDPARPFDRVRACESTLALLGF